MPVNDYYGVFVGGEYRDGEGTFIVTNPGTNEKIAEIAESGASGVDAAITSAEAALDEWQGIAPEERSSILQDVADLLADHTEELAEIETAEMGRPISESRGIISEGMGYFNYYSGVPTKIQGDTIPVPGERLDYTLREPLGVLGQIIPWNSAGILAARGIAPALACGNTVVAKPAPEAPISVSRIAELANEAGLPDGVFNVVPGGGASTGDPLTGDERISGLTFTGSVGTGKHVAKRAMENVVPINLELGGKSPSIVFPDADLDEALEDMLRVYMNSGQVCFATTRVFVHEDVYDEFVEEFAEAVSEMTAGPGEEDNDVGPLIHQQALENVEEYVENAAANGARILAGGEVVDRDANLYAPTVVDGVADDMPIACDEVFGPVVTTHKFSDEDGVLKRANDTEYGLYATVWTNDIGRAHRLAHGLEAGSVSVNEYPALFPQAPFGGYKQSGLGREKGLQTIHHFTQLKNVAVSLGDSGQGSFEE